MSRLDPTAFKALQTRLERYLRDNGIRRSPSRDRVFNLLLEAGNHVDLPSLIARAKRVRVGQATVYRALRVFQQAGLVNRIEGPLGGVAYEVAREHHDHLICTRCGVVHEFHSAVIEKAQESIARQFRFTVQFHRHEVYGLCATCAKGKQIRH